VSLSDSSQFNVKSVQFKTVLMLQSPSIIKQIQISYSRQYCHYPAQFSSSPVVFVQSNRWYYWILRVFWTHCL